ncbi:MAG: hypothetical protein ACF8XB_14690 [Planctomycetota bacterium JB042]
MKPEPPPDARSRVPVRKRIVLINAAASVGGQVANVVLLVWLQRYLLRNVAVEEYALYPVVLAPMLLLPLVTSTLTGAVGRFAVERLSRGDPRGVTEVVSTALPLSLLLAAAAATLGSVVIAGAGPLLGVGPEHLPDARRMLGLLLALAVLRIALSPLTVGPFVTQRFLLDSLLTLGTQLARLALVFSLLVLVEARVLWVVVGTVAAEAAGLAASLVVSRRLVPELRFRRALVRREGAPRLAAFGGWSMARGASMAVRRAAVPVLLNRLGTALDVACFHLGSLVMVQLQMLVALAVQPLGPPMVALHARSDRTRLRALYLRGSRYGFWVAFLFATPLVVLREELVVLYVGPEFADAATAMALLVMHLPLRLGNVLLMPLAPATDNLRPMAIASCVLHGSAVVAMAAAAALGGGAIGAAAASLAVSAIGQPLLMWPLARRIVDLPLGEWVRRALVPSVGPTLLGLAAWAALREAIAPSSWLEVGLVLAGGAAVYVGTLLVVGLTEPDRADLRAAARALLRRDG